MQDKAVYVYTKRSRAGGSQLSTIRKLAEALDMDPRELLAEDESRG